MKTFLTYNEQIDYLCVNKKIIFESTDEIEKAIYLLKSENYYNVINSVKLVKTHGINIETKKHLYRFKSFKDWETEYYKMIRVTSTINDEILQKEKNLNSFISYYISFYYISGKKYDDIFDCYIDILISQLEQFKKTNLLPKNNKAYDNEIILSQSWKFVPEITFNNLIKIFKKFPKRLQKDFFEQYNIKNVKELLILNFMRNGLLHNTPLLILLNNNDSENRRDRYLVIRKLLFKEKNYIKIIDSWNSKLSMYWNNYQK